MAERRFDNGQQLVGALDRRARKRRSYGPRREQQLLVCVTLDTDPVIHGVVELEVRLLFAADDKRDREPRPGHGARRRRQHERPPREVDDLVVEADHEAEAESGKLRPALGWST